MGRETDRYPTGVSFASDGKEGGTMVLDFPDGSHWLIHMKPEQIGMLGEALTQWHIINVQIPSGTVSPDALKGDGKKNRKSTLAKMRRERGK